MKDSQIRKRIRRHCYFEIGIAQAEIDIQSLDEYAPGQWEAFVVIDNPRMLPRVQRRVFQIRQRGGVREV
jgi:hypothetical protein